MSNISYYNILNIDSLSSMKDIEDCYIKYMNENLSEEKKRDIEKAYQTLSNYHSRRMYDNQSENNNVVKDITASNEDTGNEFFLHKSENDFFGQIEKDDKMQNIGLYQSQTFGDYFDTQMINLNRRLEQIEKKLDTSNKTNFYREKKVVTESYKDGNKQITIEYNINDNGQKSKTTKVIEYQDDGKKRTYFLKNKNNKI